MASSKLPTSKTDRAKTLRPKTLAVRAGLNRAFQETSEAMFLTSGYAYDSAEQAAARFSGDDPGHIYSRFSNPTVQAFEARLAALEGAKYCRATATGMAAVTAALLCQLSAGDHILASRALFGSCNYVVAELAPRFGIEVTLIDGTDIAHWQNAIQPNTKVLFLETPSNPGLEVLDIAPISAVAKIAGAKLVVDNVFASPILQRPLAFGADIVVYSATKHIDGQGRVLGGAILFDDEAFLTQSLQPFLRNTGPTLSAFNAWVLVKSLETLSLRVEAMSNSAALMAERLAGMGDVFARILYPYLNTHPQYDIAKRQMSAGGSLITIEFAGAPDAAQARAFAFLNHLQVIDISNNLGDAKSLATHPWTTTHHRLAEQARLDQGVTPGLVRLSIGLEDIDDLWEDVEDSLTQV